MGFDFAKMVNLYLQVYYIGDFHEFKLENPDNTWGILSFPLKDIANQERRISFDLSEINILNLHKSSVAQNTDLARGINSEKLIWTSLLTENDIWTKGSQTVKGQEHSRRRDVKWDIPIHLIELDWPASQLPKTREGRQRRRTMHWELWRVNRGHPVVKPTFHKEVQSSATARSCPLSASNNNYHCIPWLTHPQRDP